MLKAVIKSKVMNNTSVILNTEVLTNVECSIITSAFGGGYVYPKYRESYTVVPKTVQQELNTSGKVMLESVKVTKIPFKRVQNAGGGTTVYIATEGYDG